MPNHLILSPARDYEQMVLADGAISYLPLTDTSVISNKYFDRGMLQNHVNRVNWFKLPIFKTPFINDGYSMRTDLTWLGHAIGSDSNFPSGTAPRSMEIWYLSDSNSLQMMVIYGSYSNNQCVCFYLNGGNLLYSPWTGDVTVATGVCDSKWHHAVVTTDGTKWLTYNDGVAGPVNNTAPATVLGQGLHLADWGTTPSYPYSGALAHFALYNRPLTPAEIIKHYQMKFYIKTRAPKIGLGNAAAPVLSSFPALHLAI